MIEDLIIIGSSKIGSTIQASYTWTGTNAEGQSLFQRYLNGEAIEGATEKEYQILEEGIYVVAVLPVDINGNEGEIVYSDDFVVVQEIEKPIEKEYLIKAYDKNMNFVKIIAQSIITNDISYSESINAGQGQLILNLNLPIDTDYLDDIKYIRLYESDNKGNDNILLYTGYLSKYSRLFSNNKENVQATFLSIYSLMSEVYYKNEQGEDEFTMEGVEPATVIKDIIDYFNQFYSGLITYTEYSIIEYGSGINIECKNNKCSDLITNIMDGLNYYFYCGADGICYFKPKSNETIHAFTYEKDISALTIPEDYEQVINAVRVQYGYIGGPHSGITERAEDSESIAKFGRKEQTIVNQNIYGNDSAVIYRDSILNKYSKGKKNITIRINNKYNIETIHPGDTIKIRNLGLNIDGLQINSVDYTYEQATLNLEYRTTLAQDIYNINN